MKPKILILCLLLVPLLLAQSASAAPAAGYKIGWNNLLSGSGGPASSPAYKVNYTIGQTVSGTTSNSSYRVQLGYWSGVGPGVQPQKNQYLISIPLLKK